MSTVTSNPSVTTSPVVQFVGGDIKVADATGTVGFFGTTPVVQPTVAAAGSDAATTQALANSIRTILIAYGLVKA
jgi:hypothetical protein